MISTILATLIVAVIMGIGIRIGIDIYAATKQTVVKLITNWLI